MNKLFTISPCLSRGYGRSMYLARATPGQRRYFLSNTIRTLGFDVTNDIFAENAWYFRNALVRANYNDLRNGIHETTEFLELFLRNLLLNEHLPLQNRTLIVKTRTLLKDSPLRPPDIFPS